MSSFPTSIANLSNPTVTDKMNVVSHAAQHDAVNDEVEAIETALGVGMANVMPANYLDTDPMLSAASDTRVPSQKAAKTYMDAIVYSGGGIPIGYLDPDGTLATNSDSKVATQKAVKTFVTASLPTSVSGAILTLLASTPAGAGVMPAANVPAIDTLLPDQSAANGKVLGSNGSNASWVVDTSAIISNVYNYGTSINTSTSITTGLKCAYGIATKSTGFYVTNLPFSSASSYVVVGDWPATVGASLTQVSGSQFQISGFSASRIFRWFAIGT